MTAKSASNPHIGIFGGTFNPIHNGHITVVESGRKRLGLDRIRFIPAGIPPLKQDNLASLEDRLAMVRLATAGNPAFEVDDIETRRRGHSFTADTVRELKTAHPHVDWTLIMGLDALLGVGAWHQPEQVLRLTPIAVLYRPGAGFNDLAALPLLDAIDFSSLIQTTPDAKNPIHLSGDGIHLILLPVLPCSTSATAIRAAIHSGQSTPPGLSPEVTEYIISHGLYA